MGSRLVWRLEAWSERASPAAGQQASKNRSEGAGEA
jgi:hypothetical protein